MVGPPASDTPLVRRRPGYSLSGCTPAEPDSASPGLVVIGLSPSAESAKPRSWSDRVPSKEVPDALNQAGPCGQCDAELRQVGRAFLVCCKPSTDVGL